MSRYSRFSKLSKPQENAKKSENSESTPYWADIAVTSVNREYPRTSFVDFNDVDSALTKKFEESPYYYNLNGVWSFYYVDYPTDLPNDVTDINPNMTGWTTINVPGNYEVQGFGVAIYTNTRYDFNPANPDPPKLPDMNPVGVYRRKVSITAEMLKRNIYLQIGSAKTGLYCYVNGGEVGYAEDAKGPADFLINNYVHVGDDNVITLKIYKYSSASYCDDQDMWRLGGIERDVYIYTQPKLHIKDFQIVATLDDQYNNGLLRTNMSLINDDTQPADVSISYTLYSKDKLEVVSGSQNHHLETRDVIEFTFDTTVISDVLKWSAEQPNLYTIVFKLSKSNGEVLEIVPFKVGFRRTEFSTCEFEGKTYPVLLFNGQQVLYKGVNIHEHNPKTGHYLTEDVMQKDFQLLKQHNFNALRFCHYPQGRRMFELCDEYGIYVVAETNIETHGMGYDLKKGGTLANNPDWFPPHLDRTLNNYERCKNYPCVTFWSLGNEAGNGYNFYRTYDWIKHRELITQNRPVQYERAEWEFNTDLFVPMYPDCNWYANYGQSGSDRPLIPCEYSHAMGNSNGNFYKIWTYIYKYPNLQGGFIWDWVDQGIEEIGKNNKTYWTYGGDYGENAPSDGNFNINGCVNPDRNPHPALREIMYTHANVLFEVVDLDAGTFKVTNRFYFTDLSDYSISYSFTRNGEVVKTKSVDMNIPPQKSSLIRVSYDGLEPDTGVEYYINFSVNAKRDLPNIPAGHQIAYEQFELPIKKLPRIPCPYNDGDDLSLTDDDKAITVSSSTLSFVFSKEDNTVHSYVVNGYEYINENFGFQPNFWRGPTDNDYGNGEPARQQIWKTYSHNFEASATSSLADDKKSATIAVTYNCGGVKYTMTYKVLSTGCVKTDVSFVGASGLADCPRIGLRFRVPVELNNIEYFGRGPEENYWDRHDGAKFGKYQSTAEDMYFPYVRPQENGHHMDTRWLALESLNGGGLLILADDYIEFNTLRNTVEDFDDEDQTDLPRQWDNFDDCFHTHLPPHHDEASAVNRLRRQHHVDDVVFRNFVEVCVDYKMMGVAGFNSWGDQPLPEFTLPSSKNYDFGFTFVPLTSKSEIDEKIKYKYA